jgi:hypothetical protein
MQSLELLPPPGLREGGSGSVGLLLQATVLGIMAVRHSALSAAGQEGEATAPSPPLQLPPVAALDEATRVALAVVLELGAGLGSALLRSSGARDPQGRLALLQVRRLIDAPCSLFASHGASMGRLGWRCCSRWACCWSGSRCTPTCSGRAAATTRPSREATPRRAQLTRRAAAARRWRPSMPRCGGWRRRCSPCWARVQCSEPAAVGPPAYSRVRPPYRCRSVLPSHPVSP